MTAPAPQNSAKRLVDVILDELTVGRRGPEVEHERRIAIYDLLEDNFFSPLGDGGGPYTLHLRIEDRRLLFDIRTAEGENLGVIGLSLTPFRTIVKDYFAVSESYYSAIKTSSPSRIEAIDMGRRGLHDEGSQILQDRLSGKIEMSFDTARRIFTLICVLHIRN